MHRELPKSKFLAAFFLTAFIFLVVVVTNNYFNEAKLNQLNNMYNDIRADALSAEIQYELISENPCLALDFEPIAEELSQLGNKLTSMEEQLGKANAQVLNLKKYYSVLEIRQWLFIKKASERCAKSVNNVLYFYSNEGDCADCDTQGFVLSYVKKARPNTYIYSFDIHLDSSAVKTLKQNYGITSAPTLVINGLVYPGFKESDEIVGLLKD